MKTLPDFHWRCHLETPKLLNRADRLSRTDRVRPELDRCDNSNPDE